MNISELTGVSHPIIVTLQTQGVYTQDPIMRRRGLFRKGLENQLRIVDGEIVEKKRYGENRMSVVAPWFQEKDGKYVLCFKLGRKVIELDGGTHIEVATKDDVRVVYSHALEKVKVGEWDDILQKHVEDNPKLFNRKSQNTTDGDA